ncbi:hypothetical protein SDC9_176535 [bioreactor metagenome]|uniref:Uncharacterized protein n=1 Tax=bioreactor metagenome TaxID=1076179 RepID=A0A645GS94_9ZZZZ
MTPGIVYKWPVLFLTATSSAAKAAPARPVVITAIRHNTRIFFASFFILKFSFEFICALILVNCIAFHGINSNGIIGAVPAYVKIKGFA